MPTIKEAWVVILISDEYILKKKKINRDKEHRFIIINESIYQKNRIIANISVPNNRISKYIKQNWIKL